MSLNRKPEFGAASASKAAILIVEDEVVIAEDLREHLESLGYAVAAVATSAVQALGELRGRRVDLVLMDISLHGRLEGIDATVEIERAFGIPVIYISACTWPDIEPAIVASDSHGFVPKPFDRDYLEKLIDRVLQGPGAMAGASGAH